MWAYTAELLSTMRMSLATLAMFFKMLCETWKFLFVDDHSSSTMTAAVSEVYLTATHAKEPSIMYNIGTCDAPSLKTPVQCNEVTALTEQPKLTTCGTVSCDVEMRSPPLALAIGNIVNPEQVTVTAPCGIDADSVIMTFPFRTKDDEALLMEG